MFYCITLLKSEKFFVRPPNSCAKSCEIKNV
jgi:hypothetical protein